MEEVKGYPHMALSRIEIASCLYVDSRPNVKLVLTLQKQICLNHLSGQGLSPFIVRSVLQIRPRKEAHTGPEAHFCLLGQEILGSWFPRSGKGEQRL